MQGPVETGPLVITDGEGSVNPDNSITPPSPARGVKLWERVYTRREIMKESRVVLIVVGAASLLLGFIYQSGESALSAIAMGILFAVAGLIPSFWLRFVCIVLWVADLTYTNLFQLRLRPISLFLIPMASIFLYKMWRYRNSTGDVTQESAQPLSS